MIGLGSDNNGWFCRPLKSSFSNPFWKLKKWPKGFFFLPTCGKSTTASSPLVAVPAPARRRRRKTRFETRTRNWRGLFWWMYFCQIQQVDILVHDSKEINLYLEWPCGSVGSHPATGRLPLKRTSFILFPTSVFILHPLWSFSFLVFPNSIGCIYSFESFWNLCCVWS